MRDEPAYKVYLPSQFENENIHAQALFHVSAGDYLSTLASILRFFEESIHDKKITPEMRELQLKTIKGVMSDLLYLNKNYTIISKDKQNMDDQSIKKS